MRIFENQTAADEALVSVEIRADRVSRREKILLSPHGSNLEEGAFLQDGHAPRAPRGKGVLYRRDLSPLVGVHNSENLLPPCSPLTSTARAGGRSKRP